MQVKLYTDGVCIRSITCPPDSNTEATIESRVDRVIVINDTPHVVFDQPLVYALVHAVTVDDSEGAWEAWETLSLHTTEKQARDAIVEHFTPKDGENGTPYLDGTFKVIMMTVES